MANTPSSASLGRPTGPAPTPDVFTQTLLEYRWKGVAFPATSFRVHISQDLAEHKYVEKDGAEMEPTGRAPVEFQARIPFLNGAIPAPGETWPQGQLYPGQFRKFLAAASDRSKGTLQHPELGSVTCVLRHATVDWNSSTRDGVYVDASWVETFDASNSLDAILATVSPISAAISAATQVDAGITQVKPPLPPAPQYQPGLTDLIRSIQGVFDTASLVSAKVSGAIAQVNYRTNAILQAINRSSASNDDAVASVKNAVLRQQLDALRVAMIGVAQVVGSKTNQKLGIYVPDQDTTLVMLCVPLPTGPQLGRLKDLIALNPGLVAYGIVPARTQVRYYVS